MTDVNAPAVQKILQSQAFAHLATIGPNGEAQSSPMWFLWDGEYVKFTHTTNRKKYQNIKRDPRVSISITDVDEPYTYAEFRGVVERIEDDPDGSFFNTLAERYGSAIRYTGDPRVILSVKVQRIVGANLGSHYTQILIAKPDLNLYEIIGGFAGSQGQQASIVQEVRTSEALIFIFKTATPLSPAITEAALHIPGIWSLYANLDGTERQPHVAL